MPDRSFAAWRAGLIAAAGIAALCEPATSQNVTPAAPPEPPRPLERTTRPAPDASLPVPRFVSLKADRVNVRRGPGQDHGIDWVFQRAGLPVEIIAASDIWRRVRDSEGGTGWVLGSLLSSRRTALVLPWEVKPGGAPPLVPLKSEARDGAGILAQVEAGVLANIRWCDGRWCYIAIGEVAGYIEQPRLWGVYKGEVVK